MSASIDDQIRLDMGRFSMGLNYELLLVNVKADRLQVIYHRSQSVLVLVLLFLHHFLL